MTSAEVSSPTSPQITTVLPPVLAANPSFLPLRKIIAIKNVGKFRNSATQGNSEIKKHTLISGANGYGKTTLCSVLRSLQTGDPSHVIGRKTLGVTEEQAIELLLGNSTARFGSASWSEPLPNLAIFDGVFISENVHSGDVVDVGHKRNLYRVIIGQDGVHLAEEEARLVAESRSKTGDITSAANMIKTHLPAGMTLEQFKILVADPDIDNKITEQERTLEGVRQVSQLQARPGLSEITLPLLPEGFNELLDRTIEDIAEDAERQLASHLVTHNMQANGETWIAEGISHIADNACPFCGQNTEGLAIVAAYQAVFRNSYKALKAEVAAMHNMIIQGFGEGAVGRVETLGAQNRGNAEFWARYCAFDATSLEELPEISETVRSLGQAALALLTQKGQAPLERLSPTNAVFISALDAYNQAQAAVSSLNTSIRSVNNLIATKKSETGAADVRVAEAELSRLKAIKKRYEPDMVQTCSNHSLWTNEKTALDQAKINIRTQLETHTQNVIRPYEQRINELLETFNAGFCVTETRHSYSGGVAASNYQLVINDTCIDIGDGRTPNEQPSFKNTLSAGDRATLALAFFLASLERDSELPGKVVVFDDPFNSQDAFRRRQTVHEIIRISRSCAQVIVLSHDVTFLRQVWDKVPASERVALTIADHRAQGSKITLLDLERACQGRTATDIDDLQAFVTSGTGNLLDLVRKMRVVLETHCWTTYPACFEAGQDWLGVVVRKIREGGNEHPAVDLYDQLDQINDYTSQYYHGEDVTDTTPDQIDPTELTGYVRRTLRTVNALQA